MIFASEGPHISLRAETLFTLGPVDITNAILYGFLVSALIAMFAYSLRNKISFQPKKGIIEIFEFMMEFLINMMEGIFNSRRKAVKYAPVFGVFFLFIVISNLSGLIPVVGEGITIGSTPIFRPFTADLNATLSLSIIAIIIVQYYSIKESGFLGHLKHYFTDKPFNPINAFIGILEVFGEFTRILSLALRLFLNTAVGEILVAVFAFVGGGGSTFTLLPIILFEVLVALIQAYVFTVLSATYLALAIAHSDHSDEHENVHQTNEPKLSPGEVVV